MKYSFKYCHSHFRLGLAQTFRLSPVKYCSKKRELMAEPGHAKEFSIFAKVQWNPLCYDTVTMTTNSSIGTKLYADATGMTLGAWFAVMRPFR